MVLAPGTKLGPYEIVSPLGAGGMGEVYRARDPRLGRDVAVKVLPEAFLEGRERRERFEREARLLAALNHPGIAAIYSFEEIPGSSPSSSSSTPRHVLVMELLEGETLRGGLRAGPLPVRRALDFAAQIARGLAAAHSKGIVHRDLKPENIFLTRDGRAKILDFGLAKLSSESGALETLTSGDTRSLLTDAGAVMGTTAYMSPEQVRGEPADPRSDFFSFGTLLYETVTGTNPFLCGSRAETMSAILREDPPLDGPGLAESSTLARVIGRCLEKEPERRFRSAEDLAFALEALSTSGLGSDRGRSGRSFQPLRSAGNFGGTGGSRPRKEPGGFARGMRVPFALVALLALVWGAARWRQAGRERRALDTIPEIQRLVDAKEWEKAAALLKESRSVVPQNPLLEALWLRATGKLSIETTPPGATVAVRRYDSSDWEILGETPLRDARVPLGSYVWRLAKKGFVTQQHLGLSSGRRSFRLDPEGVVPAEMVRVSVRADPVALEVPGFENAPTVRLEDYFLDRTEVTNADFRKFVEHGGYARREFWKQPFVRDGRTVPWEEAMGLFRDATGRSGPSTWEAGSFPRGSESHPVAGVSWFEAAAYAEFAGKSLPSVYHWNFAAQPEFANLVAPGSNFADGGTQPSARSGALGGFGTFDMAGNVKEWCWNEGRDRKRFILGGGFGEPAYQFVDVDLQSPWERRPNYGFRCVKLASPAPAEAIARLDPAVRDYSKEKPVSEEVFWAFRGLYAYDRGELNTKVEEREIAADWTREKVSFDAAYGGERLIAHVYLPRGVPSPFQVVVFFPGSDPLFQEKLDTSWFFNNDFIVKSGRAFVVPIYKSTFERRDGLKSDTPEPTVVWRDHVVMWSKDVRRCVDYLETRFDVDRSRIAYYGLSWGAAVAPMVLATEDRFKAAILVAGGLTPYRALPEADQINFVTRVRTPVLVLNGRYDAFAPLETSQRPFVRLLGTPEAQKRHVLCESGHSPPIRERIRHILDWLDRYLGSVRR